MRAQRALLIAVLVGFACTAPRPEGSAESWQRFGCLSAVGSLPATVDELRVGTGGWKADFAVHCVPLSELRSGGPPRDGIPPLDSLVFHSTEQAEPWLKRQEPVIAVVESGVGAHTPCSFSSGTRS